MNTEQRYELLIEYAEGTLPPERRAEAEAMLSHSPEMRNDLEALNVAFDALQVEKLPAVPEQYFSNFVAVLQQRIATGHRSAVRNIPGFLQQFIRPAAALFVAASIIVLFRIFDPAPSGMTIYSLVRETEHNEIMSLIEETSAITDASTDHLFDTRFPRESFGIDPSTYQSESEMFALLEDDEAEMVVTQLQQRR